MTKKDLNTRREADKKFVDDAPNGIKEKLQEMFDDFYNRTDKPWERVSFVEWFSRMVDYKSSVFFGDCIACEKPGKRLTNRHKG